MGEDVREPVEVDAGDGLFAGVAALDPVDQLGAEDVDLAVQEPDPRSAASGRRRPCS
jgi:hypothetical protein